MAKVIRSIGNTQNKSHSENAPPNRSQANMTIDELDEIFGEPALLAGENIKDYEALEHSFRSTIKPVDVLEAMWTRDMVDAQWEILRLKKIKAAILDASKHRSLGALKQERYGPFGSDKEIGAKTYSEALQIMGYPEGALLAKSYVIHLDKLIMIENNILKLESRRNNAFKELENYRSAKSKKRNVIEDLEIKTAGGKK